MKKTLPIFLLTLCMNLIAQTKTTGNVVEYFGKEKIVTTVEGSVLYHFINGHTLVADKRSGTLFNGQDAVARQYAVGKFENPDQQKGDCDDF